MVFYAVVYKLAGLGVLIGVLWFILQRTSPDTLRGYTFMQMARKVTRNYMKIQ
jgi:hypothetical protein